MWILVHKGKGIVVSSATTRAQIYKDYRAMRLVSSERYRVERVK